MAFPAPGIEARRPDERDSPRRLRSPVSRIALVLVAALLPVAQTAYAVEIYYARAIGQEYLPEEKPPAGVPQGDAPRADELPALGDVPARDASPRELGLWSKLLIGVALVAAVAALGNGGSAQVNATPSGAPDDGGADAPAAPETGGGNGGGGSAPPTDDGNGGIDIGIGIGENGNDLGINDDRGGDRGRGRGRSRGRGGD